MSSSSTLDAAAFTEMAEPHRRALHVHCYRMLGSLDDAEDVVQEALMRAWRQRASFEGRSPFRSWLYRIATNVCLDTLRRSSKRRVLPQQAVPPNTSPEEASNIRDIRWLEPYPDRLLDQVAMEESTPEAAAISAETVELAFIAAIQLLPARQRAVLLVRDVLGWSAAETADLLDTSVASINSTLQRARATVRRQRPPNRGDWSIQVDPTEQERALLQRFMLACERLDAAAIVDMLSDDVQCAMPPFAWWFDGRAAVAASLQHGLGPERPGDFRLVATRANRQPAAAASLRAWGDVQYRSFAIHVLRTAAGRIVDITGFHEPRLFDAFGLPHTLTPPAVR